MRTRNNQWWEKLFKDCSVCCRVQPLSYVQSGVVQKKRIRHEHVKCYVRIRKVQLWTVTVVYLVHSSEFCVRLTDVFRMELCMSDLLPNWPVYPFNWLILLSGVHCASKHGISWSQSASVSSSRVRSVEWWWSGTPRQVVSLCNIHGMCCRQVPPGTGWILDSFPTTVKQAKVTFHMLYFTQLLAEDWLCSCNWFGSCDVAVGEGIDWLWGAKEE